MELQYLDFERTEDDEGNVGFDAMAAVTPQQLPELQGELLAVLAWAHEAFGPPRPVEDGGDWDCELQGVQDHTTQLGFSYDLEARRMELTPLGPAVPRITLSLTLSGAPEFGKAFREAFELDDWISR